MLDISPLRYSGQQELLSCVYFLFIGELSSNSNRVTFTYVQILLVKDAWIYLFTFYGLNSRIGCSLAMVGKQHKDILWIQNLRKSVWRACGTVFSVFSSPPKVWIVLHKLSTNPTRSMGRGTSWSLESAWEDMAVPARRWLLPVDKEVGF